jgi:dienelactone hydrolase
MVAPMRSPGRALWLCLLAACVGGAAPQHASSGAANRAAGTWRGSATYQGARLELSVQIRFDGATPHAAMSCADMLLLEQPLDGVEVRGNHVQFITPDDHPLRFDGVLDGDSLRGTAVVPTVPNVVRPDSLGPPLRFSLGRDRPAAAPPYATHDVHFTSGSLRLAGTLYTPAAAGGAHGGVVLLQGSSANLRGDYRFYANLFARAGLAVLAFDKRGNGETAGDYRAATYEMLAGDAAAAVEFLRAQAGVDPARVGVWGLSQGAFIAPLVAARVPALRFIVAVSAPGMPTGESAAYQDSVRVAEAGFDEADVRRVTTINWRLLHWLQTGAEEGELAALLSEAADTPWRRASSLPARLPTGAAVDGWYWRGRTLDPTPWWRGVQVPVLAIYGGSDELIPARASAHAIERALHHGRNRDVTVRIYPSANHVLRTLPLVAGGRWDFPRVVPGYLALVTSWVTQHTQAEHSSTRR